MPPARRNPVPRAAAGSGQCRGRLWGCHCPSSPTFLPVKPPPHPGPALGPLPSLPAAFSRCGFSLPEERGFSLKNQRQMWRSGRSWRGMNGDGLGLGTAERTC